MSNPDPRALRDAFGRFMTGVTIVTTRAADGTPLGFTANSFTSVSLDPPLLLVCPGKFLSSFSEFRACQHFALSVLAETQQDASDTFARHEGDRFARVEHGPDANGIPVIDGAVAQFSCRTHQVVDAGDHAILIGKVTGFATSDRPGLGYVGGQYFSLGLERQARDAQAQSATCGAIVQMMDTVLLEETPDGFRPPQTRVADRRGLTGAVAHLLASRGIDAEIGPVFSVFDDPASGTQFAYLRASAHLPGPGAVTGQAERLQAVPIQDLAGLTYETPAIADMMQRFAQEARTRNFTLYLGDTAAGGTHALTERH